MIIPRARLDPASAPTRRGSATCAASTREHESIFDAIANRDAEAARAAMRTHLANSRERRRRAASIGHDEALIGASQSA